MLDCYQAFLIFTKLKHLTKVTLYHARLCVFCTHNAASVHPTIRHLLQVFLNDFLLRQFSLSIYSPTHWYDDISLLEQQMTNANVSQASTIADTAIGNTLYIRENKTDIGE